MFRSFSAFFLLSSVCFAQYSVPSASLQSEMMAKVNEIWETEYKSGNNLKIAQEQYDYAISDDFRDDSDARFVLLKEAGRLSAISGDYFLSLKCADALHNYDEYDVKKVVSGIINLFANAEKIEYSLKNKLIEAECNFSPNTEEMIQLGDYWYEVDHKSGKDRAAYWYRKAPYEELSPANRIKVNRRAPLPEPAVVFLKEETKEENIKEEKPKEPEKTIFSVIPQGDPNIPPVPTGHPKTLGKLYGDPVYDKRYALLSVSYPWNHGTQVLDFIASKDVEIRSLNKERTFYVKTKETASDNVMPLTWTVSSKAARVEMLLDVKYLDDTANVLMTSDGNVFRIVKNNDLFEVYVTNGTDKWEVIDNKFNVEPTKFIVERGIDYFKVEIDGEFVAVKTVPRPFKLYFGASNRKGHTITYGPMEILAYPTDEWILSKVPAPYR